MEYSRIDLINLCESAIIPEKDWMNRDSSDAQKNIGMAYALLKAGCDFKILTEGDLKTTDKTIWVEISYLGFIAMENGANEELKESDTFFIPTRKCLTEMEFDWY